MKKILVALLAFTSVAFTFTSCSEDEWNAFGNGKVEMPNSSRAFILNEGSFKGNNSNIIYFDWATGKINDNDLFVQQNGVKLGDTGNDIEVYGNDLLVAVNVSNYVALLDGYGVEKSRISFEQYKNLGQVRNLTTIGNRVYAVSYGGYVSTLRIDGDKLVYEDSLKVGERPEDIIALKGKLYVLLQGANYNDNRMAVIEAGSKTIKYVTVLTDPEDLYVADDKVIVRGYGASYSNEWGIYDPATDTYTDKGNASVMAVANGKLLIGYSVTDWYANPKTTTSTLSAYNLATGKSETFFKNVPEAISSISIYSISVNPYDNRIYVATSSFDANGIIYVFDGEGNYERSFSAYGINPHAIVFMN